MLSSNSLLSLDPDILLLLFESAYAKGCLRPLSMTCRWIRQLSLPVLFARICLWPRALTPQRFPLSTVRPYIRTLALINDCQPNLDLRRTHFCGALEDDAKHQFFLGALHEMTRLQTVVVDRDAVISSGLPFWVLDAIFSTPQLRSVEFGPSMCLSVREDLSTPKHIRLTGPVPPLVSFRRALPSYKMYSREPAEVALLYDVFKQLHATLQVAEMPSETAPLRAFRKNDWPHLRELVLRGGPRRPSRVFMIENLMRMPNLRILKLELAQRCEAGPQPICPPGWAGGFPWPNLEVLTVASAHPDDELFAHLPGGLQELTIRCYPRHFALDAPKTQEAAIAEHQRWDSSLLTSHELLRIFRRCGTLVCLRHLDIEFATSSEDTALLSRIAAAFPSLRFLQFLRYCKGSKHIAAPWAALGDALRPMTNLRLLRVHLDLKLAENDSAIATEAIADLWRPLSPSVRFVCQLVRWGWCIDWIPHRAIREPTTGNIVGVEPVQDYESIDGYQTSDGMIPLVRIGGGRRR